MTWRQRLVFVAVMFTLAASAVLAAGPKILTVYMMRGKDANSILNHEVYLNVFRNGIFANQHLTIDVTATKAQFLDKLFSSDLVYLSVHSNPRVIVTSSGDVVKAADIAEAYRTCHCAHPSLIIVTGCQTTDGYQTNPANLAAAMGITDGTKGRAYIGFPVMKMGIYGDRYFRVFLATWVKRGRDNTYPTLQETRISAQAFVERMFELEGPGTGDIAHFMKWDADTADQFDIIGDTSLRVTDIK